MGLVASLIVIAVGAILTFAVTGTASGIDVDVVGVILMVVGLIGFLLSLMFWSSWGGPGVITRRRAYVAADPYARPAYAPRRTTVVEEEDAGPVGPPPP